MQLDRILAENHFDVEAAAAAIAADLDVINAPPPQEEAAAEQEKPSWLAALFSGFTAKAEESPTTSSGSPAAAPPPPPPPAPPPASSEQQQKQDGGGAAPFFGLLSSGSSAPCEPIHTPLAWTPCAEPEITSISSESWETQWAVVAAPVANSPIAVPAPAAPAARDKAFLTPSPSWASFEVEEDAGVPPTPTTERSTSISSSSGATSPGTISYSGDSDEPEDEALKIDEDALLVMKHEPEAPRTRKAMMPDAALANNKRRPSATPVGGF